MLTLHFAPNSRAVRSLWLLEELGLDYELNKMAFHPQDLSPHTPLHVQQRYFDRFPIDELTMPIIKPGDAEDTHYLDVSRGTYIDCLSCHLQYLLYNSTNLM